MYYSTVGFKSRKLWRKQIGGIREKNFEVEVLERLAKIESKIDDYKTFKDKTDTAYSTAKQNERDIEEINDKLKWVSRTIAAAIITIVVGAIVFAIKMM